MLNELKIKEKILKIIGGDSDYEYYPKVADEIYRLFLPALEALVQAEDMIVGEFCSHVRKHSSDKECCADFIYKVLEKLNGD